MYNKRLNWLSSTHTHCLSSLKNGTSLVWTNPCQPGSVVDDVYYINDTANVIHIKNVHIKKNSLRYQILVSNNRFENTLPVFSPINLEESQDIANGTKNSLGVNAACQESDQGSIPSRLIIEFDNFKHTIIVYNFDSSSSAWGN